ncbi:hypothetical protein COT70_02200 [candidate division WWE3 bacterium CG09_land_8_20_14_0_10_47_33]|uniref:Septum formation initiator n=1 Tax=candidate division WWE3 bacterium CG_4_9_14_0_2_um_filter_48_10 TaxID=1975078 RepID=A0A2M8EJD5_UNCKA|nr:MAG: hypothetical protein COT70_02200 [candidate division WWE3 bacterium CG09_land_8_20_14_0_10_47_33]PJC22859.1 MAG: hypothetical protein CO059_01405 [candidate division WWE3 bacterium CG_4_9_14_0_2_um_filter_48_10]PJE52209.1 MAG: hypothetical protein COV28_00755 [candidate division WWE3 bacterium CG10_big_fil_rev_8_21_14_0_10_48_23]
MSKLTLPIFFSLLFLFFLLLGRSYLEVKGRVQRLELLRDEVGILQDRKADLEEELAYRLSLSYAEQVLRDVFGYAKRGEVIVVLPDLKEKTAESSKKGEALAAESTTKKQLSLFEKNFCSWRCFWIPGSCPCP